MEYPKTLKEAKEQGYTLTMDNMGSFRPNVTYSAWTSEDNNLVALIDDSDEEVVMVFSRDPISVKFVHQKTVTGAEILGKRWKIKK